MATRVRRQPIRTCVACRATGEKRTLTRVVRQPDGTVVVDRTGKANGRGAYVCATAKCIALARKRKALSRSLKVDIPAEVFEDLLSLAPGDLEGPAPHPRPQPAR